MGYKKIADYITPAKAGNVELDILDFTEKLPLAAMFDGLRKDKYARLLIDGMVMMSETPMEHRTNREFIRKAHGDILIGGLGIGMIILAIQDDPKVKSITVIENNQNVAEIISGQIPFSEKVSIFVDDVFTYKPTKKYDCIYMDIWAYINSDIYEEMKKLKRRYGHYLKPLEESPNRFNKCWCEKEAKTNTRI